MPVITIRGQLGSGAPEIGKLIADKLQTDYVDREIIAEVAALTKDSEESIIAKETPGNSLLKLIRDSLEHSHAFGEGWQGAYLPITNVPLDDARYVDALKSIIMELATNESVVICGRGSQFILKNFPRAFHVLVVAPLELRVNYVMQKMNLQKRNDAKKEIASSDNSHREFIKRYFHAKLEDPEHYDMVINSGRLSNEAAAFIIIEAARMKN